MSVWVRAPQLSVNEDKITVAEWIAERGQRVQRGDVLAVVETTKVTEELVAEHEGHFAPLVEAGAEVDVGDAIAALTEQANDHVAPPSKAAAEVSGAPGDRRWTKKAEILGRRLGVDVRGLAEEMPGTLVTEQIVEDRVASLRLWIPTTPATTVQPPGSATSLEEERVLIVGAARGAAMVLDALSRIPNQRAVGLVDDNSSLHGTLIMDCPVVGGVSDAVGLWGRDFFDAAVVAIFAQLEIKARVFEDLCAAGVTMANVVDPTVQVATNVTMGRGNVMLGLARVGTCSQIGDNNLFSAYVNIDHHNVVGDHCTFGPLVATSGTVRIGNRVKFGAGIVIEPYVQVGDDARVASGAVITRNVPPQSAVKARPGTLVRPRRG